MALNKIYTLLTCAIIFLLSIFLRSTVDIGSDTGFYISLGKKIYEGKKYYYDFFESNLPLSFYVYALQYWLSQAFHISAILMSEIFVNLLGLASIFWSAQILKRVKFADKNHYDFIIIAFFLSFFLRLQALSVAEFGTKSSFLLLLLFPYFSYSFLEKNILSNKDLICRGALMGLMPCLKPHYIIFPLIIEFYKFYQEKSWKFFTKADILTAALIMASYLNFLIRVTSEYIEFMIPMWKEFYLSYADSEIFYKNVLLNLNNRILLAALMAPIFVYFKLSKNDKIFLLFFAAASLLLLVENIATADQVAIYYALVTIALLKFSYDFYRANYFDFSKNKWLIFFFIFIPSFDFQNSFFTFFFAISSWWVLAPFVYLYYLKYKKEFIKIESKKFIIFYVAVIIGEIYLELKDYFELAKTLGLASFILALFFFEKSYKKIYQKFSPFLIISVTLFCSYIAHGYIQNIRHVILREGNFLGPTLTTEKMVESLKTHASKPEESFVVISQWIAHEFPLMNYLNKENYYKYGIAYAFDAQAKNAIFTVNNPERAFVFAYLLDDLKKQLRDENIKIIFVNNEISTFGTKNYCVISLLEYYMRDPEFKKLFLQNFHFENRILEYKKNSGNHRANGDNPRSEQKLLHDFEVYVRRR